MPEENQHEENPLTQQTVSLVPPQDAQASAPATRCSAYCVIHRLYIQSQYLLIGVRILSRDLMEWLQVRAATRWHSNPRHGRSAGPTSHAQADKGHWGVPAVRWLLALVGNKAV